MEKNLFSRLKIEFSIQVIKKKNPLNSGIADKGFDQYWFFL